LIDPPSVSPSVIDLPGLQRKLLDLEILSASDIAWLNAFHAKCRSAVAPLLSGASLEWLLESTREIST
jgi:Xaa-Pro aminopeptidase